MAARLNPRNQQSVRDKIQVSQLVNVLTNHATGKIPDMQPTRIKAIEILLRKCMPDLQAITLVNDGDEPFKVTLGNSDGGL